MKPSKWLLGLSLLTVIGVGVGCGGGADPASNETTVSYAADVQPILTDHCGPCHIEEQQGNLSLSSYQGVTTTGQHAPIIDPGNADTSFLLIVVRSGSMPHDIPELSDEDVQTLTEWVMQGAQDN